MLRLFAGIDLGRDPAPDETKILNFLHLLEKHDLGRKMLNVVNEYLALCGVRISTGTIVDATIAHAPGSTKVEYVFRIMEAPVRIRPVRYKGIAKNDIGCRLPRIHSLSPDCRSTYDSVNKL